MTVTDTSAALARELWALLRQGNRTLPEVAASANDILEHNGMWRNRIGFDRLRSIANSQPRRITAEQLSAIEMALGAEPGVLCRQCHLAPVVLEFVPGTNRQ